MELEKFKQIINEEILKISQVNKTSSFLQDNETINEPFFINLKSIYQKISNASNQEADDYIEALKEQVLNIKKK